MSYEQAKKDHAFLWAIGAPRDMTGGYVDQGDLARLLANPSKRTAAQIFENQITYWFEIGPDCGGIAYISDPEVKKIAALYGCENALCRLGDPLAKTFKDGKNELAPSYGKVK